MEEHFLFLAVQPRMKRWILLLLCVAASLVQLPAFAAGLIIVDDIRWLPPRPHPPIIIPPRPPERPWRPAPLSPIENRSTKATAKITDQVAVTTVEQEFYNPNAQRMEGTFIFPVPKGAQLDKFRMDIDGKPVEAELLAADKARGIYEDIVRKMKDPALLEYAGQDLYKVRIFPFEPRSSKRISMSYTQLLRADNGLLGYILPLGVEKYAAGPVKSLSVKLELEGKQPIKNVYSPSHKVEIRRDGDRRAVVGFEASDVTPDTDFQLFYALERSDIGLNLLTYRTGSDDGFFVLLAAPAFELSRRQVVLKDVAFVLDTSGSMAGNKLEQAKKALQFCVENLNDGDRFEIIRFSTETEPLFDKLMDASRENRRRARDFIQDLKPTGGTAIDDALKKALALRPAGDRPFMVIFLTDGKPTIGETVEDNIVANAAKAGPNTRIFCFGIGSDLNTHLLDKITERTRAASQYVLADEDLELKVSSFFAKINQPVLADLKVTFPDGVRVTKMYPSPLPDLFHGEQMVVAGRYSGTSSGKVVLGGSVNGEKREFSEEVRFSDESRDYSFIPRLWATRRVAFLLDEIRLRGENSELKDEVTKLARDYGIVTPYTAYLIVEDEDRRRVPMTSSTMSGLRQDREAQQVARDATANFFRAKEGADAVASARANSELRLGDMPAEALARSRLEAARPMGGFAGGGRGGRAGGGGGGGGSFGPNSVGVPVWADGSSAAARVDQYTQQSRFVNGRNFYQNGAQWVDSQVQMNQNARKVRVQFNSAEYFELVRKEPEIRPWLALGQNLQFVLRDTVYEIYE
jgi:Ca-activated chloride channel family protein